MVFDFGSDYLCVYNYLKMIDTEFKVLPQVEFTSHKQFMLQSNNGYLIPKFNSRNSKNQYSKEGRGSGE
ncbi:hypothetical protein A6770_05985 [Nostoc minutum NIES-26]|uniref:Uncharacterized protein n=1 Tax=Nostoc minutum NIES-26 TaxID=1844469 RepID=A0A367Q6A1_9NOSO|nr:hypothetical protein A6770_05985 [Nostoc minutum NIES-26]